MTDNQLAILMIVWFLGYTTVGPLILVLAYTIGDWRRARRWRLDAPKREAHRAAVEAEARERTARWNEEAEKTGGDKTILAGLDCISVTYRTKR